MTDFLLELRSEEIPARMQAKARDDLARLFAAELAKAGLTASATQTYATPRRLALIARDLPDATAAVSEEVKGPRTTAPPQALEGFLRKTGLTRERLTERDGVWFAVTEKPGRATAAVLADAIPTVIRAFPWPKSMRWGEASQSTDSLRWVRPLHGIVALFGDDIVPVEIAGITSGAATLGHRFHHPGPITIGSANDYIEKLRACHVLVDQAEREALIRDTAHALAAEAGLELIADEGLVAENAGLTEWPAPLLGRFDETFLDVPPEVIQLTARVNQKYFVCNPPRDGEGDRSAQPSGGGGAPQANRLANAFICTANVAAPDGGAKIVEGNRKVLAARLSDARFFYEQDLKVPLEEQAKKLDRIVFHEKLGTVADKVERVAKLARWLVEEGIVGGGGPTGSRTAAATPHHPREGGGPVAAQSMTQDGAHQPDASHLDPRLRGGGEVVPGADGEVRGAGEGARAALADLAERAARLCKADLVTGMVAEFPELQGVMGGYYALAQGEDPRVAEAIRDHYKPVGQGDEVPTAPVTVAVSLADKLDSLAGFFGSDLRPTGSKDPFALRRAALAVVSVILQNEVRCSILQLVRRADFPFAMTERGSSGSFVWVLEFLIDRLKVQQREAGVRHDLIDAVFALGGEDDLVRLLARVHALQSFMASEDGANLLTGYRRAANILKKEGWTPNEKPGHPGPFGEAQDRLVPGSRFSPSTEDSGAPGLARGDEMAARPNSLLSYTPEPAEEALIAALDSAEPRAASAVASEKFENAMAALASLRAPIDAFFDTVTVNDPDPAKRAARLALLARVRDAVHTVADFSRIEG